MELTEAKQQFIQAWGTLGSNWGINKTMAQVHALLLVSSELLCADDIMNTLEISRGNANMNIRALIDWGLVYKRTKEGERRDYFLGEKEMWTIFRQIVIHRKKKELEPMLNMLKEVKELDKKDAEHKAFLEVMEGIELFAKKADVTLDKLVERDSSWLISTLLKLV